MTLYTFPTLYQKNLMWNIILKNTQKTFSLLNNIFSGTVLNITSFIVKFISMISCFIHIFNYFVDNMYQSLITY